MSDRTAPDGSTVAVDFPDDLGVPEWFGYTRLSGVRLRRDFHIAPLGQHRAIPRKLMPGAREQVFRRRGHDVVLYEATNRSDSALVWLGPYHEATTWFGGPAPRPEILSHLMAQVAFADSPNGAQMTPTSSSVQQFGTWISAWSDVSVVTIRSAAESASAVPEWQGLRRNGREVWRQDLGYEGEQARKVAGTPYEWRYLIAGATALTEAILRAEERFARRQSPETALTAIVDHLDAEWRAA